MLSVAPAVDETVSILHAEGDRQTCAAVAQFLRLELDDVTTTSATDIDRIVDRVDRDEVDCIISAYQCDSVDGLALLRAVRDHNERLPFLFFTDVHDELAAVRALDSGADGYLRRVASTERYVRLAQRVESLVASRRREESLVESVQDFSRLFNRTDDVFWMYTGDWSEAVFVNSSYEDVWGQPLSRLEDDPAAFLEAVHPDDRTEVRAAMEQISSGSPVDIELRVNPREEFGRWVWVQGTPITGPDGGVDYVAGYVRDVSERKERQRELERRAEQLERQADRREFFNSVLRHDVLNGMNVIQGRSEYLVDELETDEYVQQAETVHRWADDIIDVIEHIRTILQTIQGQTDSELESVALRPVVAEEIERVAAAYPDVTFGMDVPETARVRANELLSTVIHNLLTNAVEHNDPDGLAVSVTAVEKGPAVHVRVADTGGGIPDERKEAVFSRGESTRDRERRGGLGLFLVDTLVTTYGGAVWIEDNEPSGTVVCLDLPAA